MPTNKNILSLLTFFLLLSSIPLSAQFYNEIYSGSLPGLKYSYMALGDIDNTGSLDLAICGYDASNVARTFIYKNNGAGNFSLAQTLTGVAVGGLAFGDIDSDGALDLVVTGSGSTLVYRNNGTGNFFVYDNTLQPLTDAAVALGDLDNDGNLDIVLMGNAYGTPRTFVYRNMAGPFTLATTLAGGTRTVGGLALADFNNDGRLDITLLGDDFHDMPIDYYGVFKIYGNNGNFQFNDITPGFTDYPTSGSVTVCDMNNDRYPEIAYCAMHKNNSGLRRFIRNDAGTFVDLGLGPLTYNRWGNLASADLNNDGYPDIVQVGDWGTPQSLLFTRNGDFNYTQISPLPGVRNSMAVVGDLNNDGKLDIILSGDNGTSLVTKIYANADPMAPANGTPSSIPAGSLKIMNENGYWKLRWPMSWDSATPTNLIKYQVALYTNTGEAYVPKIELPPGQAIVGSAFYTSNRFCYKRTSIPAGYSLGATVLAIDSVFAKSVTPSTFFTNPSLPVRCSQPSVLRVQTNSVLLTWTDLANELGYRIYRSASSNTNTMVFLQGSSINASSNLDATTVPDATYFYSVKAFNKIGASPFSPIVRVTTPLRKPLWLMSNIVSESQIFLSWQPQSTVLSYTLYRSVSSSTETAQAVAGFLPSRTSTTDRPPLNNKIYSYWVKARNLLASSPFSESVVRIPLSIPSLPSNIQTTTLTSNSIGFSWNSSTNALGHRIFRNTSRTTNGATLSILPPASSFLSENLLPNTKYYFWIKSTNTDGSRGWTSPYSNRTLTPIPKIVPETDLSKISLTNRFLFTNKGTMGAGGCSYYRIVFDQSASTPVQPSDMQWSPVGIGTIRTNIPSDEGHWYLHIRGYNADHVGGAQLDLGPCKYYSETVGPFSLGISTLRIDDNGTDLAIVSNRMRLSNTRNLLDIVKPKRFIIEILEGQCDLVGVRSTNGHYVLDTTGSKLRFAIRGKRINQVKIRVTWDGDENVSATQHVLISPKMDLRDDNDAVIYNNVIDPDAAGEEGHLFVYFNSAEGEELTVRIYDIAGRRLLRTIRGTGGQMTHVEFDLLTADGKKLPEQLYGVLVEGRNWRKEMKFVVKRR